jgi:hypothetical protein
MQTHKTKLPLTGIADVADTRFFIFKAQNKN